MAALNPDHRTDIFISYRQNDNLPERHGGNDGWVTRFVEELEKAMRSVMKERVTIYFDQNPTDGLLESHDVGDSLSQRILTTVFIPILSQTYCDVNSFAWKHEFIAFRDWAASNLKVKLRNGNVASRVLPVKIHDLEAGDLAAVENEIGPLRALDFVYRSAGVNRPLKPEDHRQESSYHDQVNKVALAAKEIILATQPGQRQAPMMDPGQASPMKGPMRRKWFILPAALVVVAAILYSWNPWQPGPNATAERKAIAVMPFKVIGDDKESRYIADGVMDAVLGKLSVVKSLRVKSRTSVEKYRNLESSIGDIVKDLQVDYILEGSAQKYGEDVRVTVQLIEASTNDHMWYKEYDRKLNTIFELQADISKAIAGELKAKLTPEEISKIESSSTTNAKAYQHFIQAKSSLDSMYHSSSNDLHTFNKAQKLLKRAISEDRNFADAYFGLGATMVTFIGSVQDSTKIKASVDSAEVVINQGLRLSPLSSDGYNLLSYVAYYRNQIDVAKASLEKALELNPGNWEATSMMNDPRYSDDLSALRHNYRYLELGTSDSIGYYEISRMIGHNYMNLGEVERSETISKNVMFRAPETGADWTLYYVYKALMDLGKLKYLAGKIEIRDPETFHKLMAEVFMNEGEFKKAEDHLRMLVEVGTAQSESWVDSRVYFAWVLRKNGKSDAADKVYERALTYFNKAKGAGPYEEVFRNYIEAHLHAYRMEWDKVIECLGRKPLRWMHANYLPRCPLFEPVWNDPKFKSIMQRSLDEISQKRMRLHQMEQKNLIPAAEVVFKEWFGVKK